MNKEKVPYLITVFGKGYGAMLMGLVLMGFPLLSMWIGGGVDFTNVVGTIAFTLFEVFGAFLFVINIVYIKNYRKK